MNVLNDKSDQSYRIIWVTIHCLGKHSFIVVSVSGVGMLLFIAHAKITRDETKCRFYGPCAVTSTVLNGVVQPPLTEVGPLQALALGLDTVKWYWYWYHFKKYRIIPFLP